MPKFPLIRPLAAAVPDEYLINWKPFVQRYSPRRVSRINTQIQKGPFNHEVISDTAPNPNLSKKPTHEVNDLM